MEHLAGVSLGKAPALLANVRLGWKGLPGTNIIAYYKHFKITDKKSFIAMGPGANVIKLFVRDLRIFLVS
jgi:hypothetical protein